MKINNTLTETAREAVETALGYRFRNRALLTQAFTRTSYANETKQLGFLVESNEVPEFFGDAILAAVVADYLFDTHITADARGMHANCSEGELTLAKSALTDKQNLSRRIFELGFDKYLLITTGEHAQQVSNSMAEDLFEALTCAVWVDSGRNFDITRAVVRRMLAPESGSAANCQSAAPMAAQKPAKSALQEWCDAKKRRFPFVYAIIGQSGSDDCPTFTAELTVTLVTATGEGETKDSAEACAVYNAYEHLKGALGSTDALRDLEWCRACGIEHWLISENVGTKNSPRYEAEGTVRLTVYATASTKKQAETNAAEQALQILKRLEELCAPRHSAKSDPTPEAPAASSDRTARVKPAAGKNARMLVKEWCDRHGCTPDYLDERQEGPKDAPTFSVMLAVAGFDMVEGTGSSKSAAKEDAAAQMWEILRTQG